MKKLLILSVSLILLTACSQAGAPTEDTVAPEVETTEQNQDQMMEAEPTTEESMMENETENKVVAVEGDNFTFDVKEIRVKKGEKVTVAFTNKEGFHDFVIDELDVNTDMVAAGATKEVTIPTDKPGTYEYYCSVGDHRAKGMKGTLIIE